MSTNIKAEIQKLVKADHSMDFDQGWVSLEYIRKLESLVLELGEVCEVLDKIITKIECDSVPNECDGGETSVIIPDEIEAIAHQALAKLTAKLGGM